MSTYLYLVCVDHDPPLKSADEVGQHLTDLPTVRAVLANRHSDSMQRTFADRYADAASRFLNDHPKCNVRIRDEYGREHPTTTPEEAPVSNDIHRLRPGMIAAVTLDDGTVIPPAEVRDERGVGLYVGPILARLHNGHRAPGVASVAVEDDEDAEVEALAREIGWALGCGSGEELARIGGDTTALKGKFVHLSPESRRMYRRAAQVLVADGWRRNQPETVEVVKDCFDNISDDNLKQIAERPEAAPVSLVMSVASRRARKALDLRRDRRNDGQRDDEDTPDVSATILECARGLSRNLNRDAQRLNDMFARRFNEHPGGDAK